MSLSFSAPSSAPATTGLSGFSFGNKPTTSSFGLNTSQTSTGLFGATGTSSAPTFGATAAPAFGASTTPGFGASTTPGFGATVTPGFGATATPNFGAATTPAFGLTQTPAFGAGTSAIPAFGTTSAPAFGTSLNFGTGTNTTQSTGLNFGQAQPVSSTGLGGLGGFGFGTQSTNTQSTGLGLFGSTSTATTSTSIFVIAFYDFQMYPNNNIPVTQTFQMIPPHHGNVYVNNGSPNSLPGIHKMNDAIPKPFHIVTPSRDNYVLLEPRSGGQLNTTSVIGTQPSVTGTPSLGLGGVGTTAGFGVTSTSADGKEQQPKHTKLPNELSTTINSFKEFVKKQKSLSSDVMRVSIKPFHKVSREAEETLRAVGSLSGEVSKARAQSCRLRNAAADALAAAEQAARDITGSELESTAPPLYVKELIAELEQQLITFRRQMDVAGKQMHSTPKLLSEQELTLGIRRMHESLVALAGRLQAAHTQVEAQKEQYLNLRKYILKDNTDVFATQTSSSSLDQILRDAENNRKKSKTAFGDMSQSSAVLSDPRQALSNIQQLAGPSPFTYVGHGLTSFPNSDSSGISWHQPQPTSTMFFNPSGLTSVGSTTADAPTTSFQLQKPPKRGKQ